MKIYLKLLGLSISGIISSAWSFTVFLVLKQIAGTEVVYSSMKIDNYFKIAYVLILQIISGAFYKGDRNSAGSKFLGFLSLLFSVISLIYENYLFALSGVWILFSIYTEYAEEKDLKANNGAKNLLMNIMSIIGAVIGVYFFYDLVPFENVVEKYYSSSLIGFIIFELIFKRIYTGIKFKEVFFYKNISFADEIIEIWKSIMKNIDAILGIIIFQISMIINFMIGGDVKTIAGLSMLTLVYNLALGARDKIMSYEKYEMMGDINYKRKETVNIVIFWFVIYAIASILLSELDLYVKLMFIATKFYIYFLVYKYKERSKIKVINNKNEKRLIIVGILPSFILLIASILLQDIFKYYMVFPFTTTLQIFVLNKISK